MAPEEKAKPSRIVVGGNSKDQKALREMQAKVYELEKVLREMKTDFSKFTGEGLKQQL